MKLHDRVHVLDAVADDQIEAPAGEASEGRQRVGGLDDLLEDLVLGNVAVRRDGGEEALGPRLAEGVVVLDARQQERHAQAPVRGGRRGRLGRRWRLGSRGGLCGSSSLFSSRGGRCAGLVRLGLCCCCIGTRGLGGSLGVSELRLGRGDGGLVALGSGLRQTGGGLGRLGGSLGRICRRGGSLSFGTRCAGGRAGALGSRERRAGILGTAFTRAGGSQQRHRQHGHQQAGGTSPRPPSGIRGSSDRSVHGVLP